jgi:LPS-assembly lipoprotein
MKKATIPFILALLLSACGFHLRGVVDIPTWLSPVAVISMNDTKGLAKLLEVQLEGYKIQVSKDPLLAKYWIVINSVTVNQQIISIGSSTNPRQYQLVMAVNYSLKTSKGKQIKPPKNVFVSRQFTVNNDRVLGSNEEEAVLLNEMRQDAVIQIMNRLSKK